MIKGVSVCAMSLMFGSPAFADERSHDSRALHEVSSLKAEAGAVQPDRNRAPVARSSVRFALPAQFQKPVQRAVRSVLPVSFASRNDRPFSLTGDNQEDGTQEALRLTETTAGDGGRYAVNEALSDYRKPRFRRSALGTMLTLRLDGEAESPPFSVGGGGVAAVVWQAMPKP